MKKTLAILGVLVLLSAGKPVFAGETAQTTQSQQNDSVQVNPLPDQLVPPTRFELSEGFVSLAPVGVPGAGFGYGMDTRVSWFLPGVIPDFGGPQLAIQAGFIDFAQGAPGASGNINPTIPYFGIGIRKTWQSGCSFEASGNAGMVIGGNYSSPEPYLGFELKGELPKVSKDLPVRMFASVGYDFLGNMAVRGGSPFADWAVPVEAGFTLAF